MIQHSIIGVLSAAFLIFFMYELLIFSRFWFVKKQEIREDDLPPLSVIICARNEYDNLKNFLPKVLEQDYPNFEVVVVNDCSSDDSENLLATFKSKYKHLYYTTIEEDEKFHHTKKLAVSIGIKAAKNECLVFTDADCYPASDQWLKHMGAALKNKDIVLGYGKYEERKGFLNMLIRAETFLTARRYFSYALSGFPYMGVGRNMGYKKSLFYKNGGFSKHLKLLSGDDDLFVNANANRQNTALVFHPLTHTISIPAHNFRTWKRQKSRHLTTGNKYKRIHKILLGFETVSRLLIIPFLFLAINSSLSKYILISSTILLVLYLINLNKANRDFQEGKLFLLLPLADILLSYFNVLLYLFNRKSRINKWK